MTYDTPIFLSRQKFQTIFALFVNNKGWWSMNVETFDDVLASMKAKKRPFHLLLGNGFSMAYDLNLLLQCALWFHRKARQQLLVNFWHRQYKELWNHPGATRYICCSTGCIWIGPQSSRRSGHCKRHPEAEYDRCHKSATSRARIAVPKRKRRVREVPKEVLKQWRPHLHHELRSPVYWVLMRNQVLSQLTALVGTEKTPMSSCLRTNSNIRN